MKKITVHTDRVISDEKMPMFMEHLRKTGTPENVVGLLERVGASIWFVNTSYERVTTTYLVEDAE